MLFTCFPSIRNLPLLLPNKLHCQLQAHSHTVLSCSLWYSTYSQIILEIFYINTYINFIDVLEIFNLKATLKM